MGIVTSILCAVTFCIERVITWSCCAFLLVLLLFTLIILMIYGISVGYHYAQTELASFAMASRTTTPKPGRRSIGGGLEDQPVVRLVAVKRSEDEGPQLALETITSENPYNQLYLETTGTSIVLLETERAPEQQELSPNVRNYAKRLIGRIRRSRKAMTNVEPFLRPLRITNTTKLLLSFR